LNTVEICTIRNDPQIVGGLYLPFPVTTQANPSPIKPMLGFIRPNRDLSRGYSDSKYEFFPSPFAAKRAFRFLTATTM
jgi:hypothetical protein